MVRCAQFKICVKNFFDFFGTVAKSTLSYLEKSASPTFEGRFFKKIFKKSEFSYFITIDVNCAYIYESITLFWSVRFANLSHKIDWKKVIVKLIVSSQFCVINRKQICKAYRPKQSNIFVYVCTISIYRNEI
jgi:hypothetical protein